MRKLFGNSRIGGIYFAGIFSAGAEILVKFSHDRGGVGSAH
jgi:hypothetical protein